MSENNKDAEIREELQALSDLEFEQSLKFLKERHGVPIGYLRKLRKSTINSDNNGSGTALAFEEIEATADPVDPAGLLDELTASVKKYVSLPDGAAETIATWVLFAWTHDTFSVSPILAIQSPQKGSGKTTLLDWTQRIVPRPLPASHATTAALFRSVEKWRPTLLLDEADSFLKDNEDMRGLLNSGHVRTTARVLRTVDTAQGPEVKMFSSWAPKAIAGIGKLPATLQDRSIQIMLQRKRSSDKVQRLRIGRDEAYFHGLRQQCANFADQYGAVLSDFDPEIPAGLSNRKGDNWAVFFSIADVAGDHWPQTMRKIAEDTGSNDDTDVRTQLLQDLKTVFDESGRDEMSSQAIVKALAEMEESPWSVWGKGSGGITQRHLAGMLSSYGIHSENVYVDGTRLKGYRREFFIETWERYLYFSSDPENKRTTVPMQNNLFEDNDLQRYSFGTGTDKESTTDTNGTQFKRTVSGKSTEENRDNSFYGNDIDNEWYGGTDKTEDGEKKEKGDLPLF
ncbi:MAG: DUF3631 domain-containing protein [Spirochaetota bacterium]|nr:DUF3631 domain-containing protein [Spirochaetota bacterium]